MRIKLDQVPEEGLHLLEEESADVLELAEDHLFRAAGPICCKLYVQLVSESLIVRGAVSAEVHARCARCFQIFSTTVRDSAFLRDYPALHGMEEVELVEDLREAILLNLPHFPLCNEDCKGLCVQCGKNLNEGLCNCLDGSGPRGWEALDSLNL